MATAMTMTMYHQAVSLQAFTDSYFSPYSALYNHQRQHPHPLHSSQSSYIPHQPQQHHQHQQQLPGASASPYLTPTADSCRSPYTHPPTRTRARSRTISLAASPLLHPPQTPAPSSSSPPSQSLSSYDVEHHILAPTSILYTSTSPAPGTTTLGASPRGRNIWRFTGAAPSSSPSSLSAPSPPASNTTTPAPAPSPSTQPTHPTPPKPSTQPKPTPESLELARAKAQSLQRSRARVVAGMILHRVYCHAPRTSQRPSPRPQRPSLRPRRDCESRSPDSVRQDSAPARGRSACLANRGSGGGSLGGSRLKEVIYSCYWDEDANEDEDTASEGEGSDAESEGSEGTLVDADLEETAHLEKGQAKAKAFDDVDEA